MSDHSPEWEMSRALRAVQRDNAVDAVAAAYEREIGLDRDTAVRAAEVAVQALAAWIEQRASPTLNGNPFIRAADWAASLMREFTPAG